MTRKLLVTSALPYANGPIHLGHMVEYIQTDIWVRFQKLVGNTCVYVCADDAHGTPIMLSAKKRGISPEQLIQETQVSHLADFHGFGVEFDVYHSTHSDENQELVGHIYQAASEKGYIQTKDIAQLFCESCHMFLPDRFIKGACPKCKAEDQWGDNCEVCSATYAPTELLSPRCAECGKTPVTKKSTHYFFTLSKLTDFLKNWVKEGSHVRAEIANKLDEWFEAGIQDWDISRDAPYFGFQIPGTTDKYFYVWMDAPVGYMAATQKWCTENNQSLDMIWKSGEYEIHHFIGKDIVYFHSLFWPAMLHVAGYQTPTKINIHGFLTLNGQKMSKSKGTYLSAQDYLMHYDPEFLRYYYAAKLSGAVEDIDFRSDDFVNRVNSDVIGKFINIASRTAAVLNKKLSGKMTEPDVTGQALLTQIQDSAPAIAQLYDQLDYAKAMRDIMALADQVNKYIHDTAPWELVVTNPARAAQICTTALNAMRFLAIYLKPVLPKIAQGVEEFLLIPPLTWTDIHTILTHHAIGPYVHLAKRLELADVEGKLVGPN